MEAELQRSRLKKSLAAERTRLSCVRTPGSSMSVAQLFLPVTPWLAAKTSC
jgi:hypothetical protein